MSKRVKRLEMEELRPDLAEALAPRVKRLGYLGEFFRVAGNQPDATIAFQQYTEASKKGLPERQVELIALTVATLIDNAYERHQHERLSIRLGFGREWVREVERLDPSNATLDDAERAVQTFVIEAVRSNGRGVAEPFERVVDAVGPDGAVAVLMVIGRYLVHGLLVNTFELEAPVPSIFEDGFEG
jgi:alkylhydroperoxidase family enzyme